MILLFIILSIALGIGIFLSQKRSLTNILSVLYLILLTGISVYALLHINETDSKYFKFDEIGLILTFILLILSYATFFHSRLYLKRHKNNVKREAFYYASLMMLITALLAAYFAENIAVLWVCIEATTLLVSLLINFERSKESLEAAWKYLFVSSVGVAIAFIGILFLSITASDKGVTNLSLSYLLEIANSMDAIWLKMSFLLVLTGFSAKMGLFPIHTVAVDAHTVAPPPISAFISTTLMNAGFLGIFRVYTIVVHTSILPWAKNVLLIAGVLSIFLSGIQLLRIKHYKRMFAFSSLEHMGIVAIGLAVGGLGYYAAILHLVFHSFVKASLFYQIGQVHHYYKSYWIKDAAGYFKQNPIGGLSIILGFISILAIPPSGMFVSEFYTFKALFVSHHYYIAVFILIMLTIIIYSFSRYSFHLLYDEESTTKAEPIKRNIYEPISQFILIGLVIYLGVNPPEFFTNLIHAAVAILN